MVTWQPHTLTTQEVVEHGPVAALAALLDDDTPRPGPGEALPPLWHWVALPRWTDSSELGLDGHPRRGSFLPPVELPRRMFAGGEVVLHSPVTLGSTVRRESIVSSVQAKSGRSGPMVVVVVETSLYDEGGALLVEERQDIIYRLAGATATAAMPRDMAPTGMPVSRIGPWEAALATDPVTLMRFSAATANAHRIHYDWPYATVVEGYPGLVVHGPFMTLALAELVRIEQPDARVRRLTHRNRQPLFCGEPAVVRRLGGDELHHSLALVPGNAADSDDASILTSLDVELAR